MLRTKIKQTKKLYNQETKSSYLKQGIREAIIDKTSAAVPYIVLLQS